ncbi:unnamed protein product [Coffea canephora]|uniref:RRM domain-containing protein n=1 Tax=Coffea canephora TaxID=49390 RepID=A0A068UKX2_COFCA|nr:unnamed protein product [Coffea canephora]
MRPIFCGNLEFDARQSDVERLFRKYGKVERVDMKSGLLGLSMIFLDGWFSASLFWLVPKIHVNVFPKGPI